MNLRSPLSSWRAGRERIELLPHGARVLEHLRNRITELDLQLLQVLAARRAAINEIAEWKSANAVAARDIDRELAHLANMQERARALGLNEQYVADLFTLLFREGLRQHEPRD